MTKGTHLRQSIAAEAARILAEQRYLSYSEARDRAAAHLGVKTRNHLPDNLEIESALKEYQAIFLSDRQPRMLQKLRDQALNAMRMFEGFKPRLVGDVASGSADEHSPVELLLHAESAEEVIFFLIDRHIPWQEIEVSCHYADGSIHRHPGFSFTADDIEILLTVLNPAAMRNPPLNRVTGHPDRGVSLAELEQLLADPDQRSDIGL